MNTVAWVLQIVLAIIFLLHGLVFTVAYGAAAKRMAARARAPSSLPPTLRQFIGVAEMAAAFGLTVPPAVHVFPWLAPLAAAGLVLVMVGAAGPGRAGPRHGGRINLPCQEERVSGACRHRGPRRAGSCHCVPAPA